MKSAAAVKYVSVTPSAAIVDNAAFTTAAIDTKGWGHCTIIAYIGAIDIAFASATLRYADNSSMNSATTFATGGTDFALATAADSDNEFHVFEVDMKGKDRYLDLSVTGGDGAAGTYMAVLAILSRPSVAPSSASGRGVEVYGKF